MKIGTLLIQGSIKMDGKELILDADGDTSIIASTDDQIVVKVAGANQIVFKDGSIEPITDNDVDIGSSTKTFALSICDTALCDTRVGIPYSAGDPSSNGQIKIATGVGTGGVGLLKFMVNDTVQYCIAS